ncbi:unnamed protein product [Macrosiphum euphorbiae]|uniref:Uncharacterized protein n=1 Tax=Macrosiphum euphorbiae TaxID=13131 RepID=A0AAV0WU06_9HEMI|nr:unnamed protein product [Macrosiphum euphorbiae]
MTIEVRNKRYFALSPINYTNEYYISCSDWKCTQREKPFTMSAYETDADGLPVGQSNSTVVPYNVEPRCFTKQMVKDGFMLTTDGSLYLTGDHQRVPDVLYCVEYYAEAGAQVDAVLQAFVCGEDTQNGWMFIFLMVNSMASIVCLALTLLVYNTLPSFQNSRNYYVKPYIAVELMSFLCAVIKDITNDIHGYTCVLYGISYLHCYHSLINSYHIFHTT